MLPHIDRITKIRDAVTRSVSAENPNGAKGGGALAAPGDDAHTSPAASELGKGWKVRPCLKDLKPGESFTLADIDGPGTIQHIWMTVLDKLHRHLSFEVYYDSSADPSIRVPLGDFFANGLDGIAKVNSLPIVVAPRGGMNSYWPMPFRRHIRIVVRNDGPTTVGELFYQITYELGDVEQDAGYLHASWRREMTTRQHPEMVIADGLEGPGQFVGTYLVWSQLSNGWWGEGEVKFFIDGDTPEAPTICGTGTEDYFGGAWGFIRDHPNDQRPELYSTPYLGYPQCDFGSEPSRAPIVPRHALYRWHIPDPIRFQSDLRATVQALGWYHTGKFQPLTDDISATAYWYASKPGRTPELPGLNDRLPR